MLGKFFHEKKSKQVSIDSDRRKSDTDLAQMCRNITQRTKFRKVVVNITLEKLSTFTIILQLTPFV